MRKLSNNRIQYSIKDLLKFNDSKFESFMDRIDQSNPVKKAKKEENITLKWVQNSGNFFEQSRLDQLKKELIKNNCKENSELLNFLFKNYSLNSILESKFKRINEDSENKEIFIPEMVTNNLEVINKEIIPFIKDELNNFVIFKGINDILKIKESSVYEKEIDKLRDETIKAIKDGKKLIYQGLLKDDKMMGSPDILLRVTDTKPYLYEVLDIKRSNTPKAKFVLQICAYSDLLAQIQGVLPEFGEILLGNGRERFKLTDFYNYYKTIKNKFYQFHDSLEEENPQINDLTGEWDEIAKEKLLGLIESIPNIKNNEIVILKEQNIFTTDELNNAQEISGLAESTVNRLKKQSLLVKDYDILEQLKDEPGNLYDLPDFNENDIYLDIKQSESLDKDPILFFYNIYYKKDGEFVHETISAGNSLMEEARFKYFLSFITPILENKETGKFGKIYSFNNQTYPLLLSCAAKYHKGYFFLNKLFNQKSFICLNDFLMNSVVLNIQTYSMDNISKILNFNLPSLDIGFESALVSLKEHKKSNYDIEIENDVEDALNRLTLDKMIFLKMLHEWLLKVRNEENIKYIPEEDRESFKQLLQKRLDKIEKEKESSIKKEEDKQKLIDKILKETNLEKKKALEEKKETIEREEKFDKEIEERNTKLKNDYIFEAKDYGKLDLHKKLMVLNLQLQDFNKREKDLKDLETHQLRYGSKSLTLKNLRCLTDLRLTSHYIDTSAKSARSHFGIGIYKFNLLEDSKIEIGDNVIIKNNPQFGGIRVIDMQDGNITLRFGSADMDKISQFPIITIIENKPNLSQNIDKYIKEKQAFLEEDHPTLNINKCYYDFLARKYPDIDGVEYGADLYTGNEDLTKVAIKLVENMNNTCLVIQGPPGVGKSYTASKVIANLLQKGKRIMVSSNSNKAIDGLLLSIKKEIGTNYEVYKHSSEEELPSELSSKGILNCNDKFLEGKLPDACVIGCTVFGSYKYKADYLFVDEAGQVAISNLFVMSSVVENMVLIGDQNQLEQPTQGVHPGESGESALEYFLKTDNGQSIKVIPKNKGLFLPVTRRMNSELCRVVSKYFYENQLKSIEDVENSKINTQLNLNDCKIITKNKGVQFINVPHKNNPQYSTEEVQKVKEVVDDLLGKPIVDGNGVQRTIIPEDIIIVSPFNLQVSKLKKEFPDYMIGSVDLFQGQEAPIVIYSLGASEASARGLSFLLNPNRTNVALSRGKALAVIIGSEHILQCKAESIEDLKLLSTFSELIQL